MSEIFKRLNDLSEAQLFTLVEAIDAEMERRAKSVEEVPDSGAAARCNASKVTGGAWGLRRRR